jgi:cobalt-zinc-cadmium efflux system protein
MARTAALEPAHHHAHAGAGDRRRLTVTLALIVAFMAVEVAVGVLAHSLALLSDAGHMLTDAGALGFALVASVMASRPAYGPYTFGLRRAEILSAQANGATLLVVSALVLYGAVRRLISPPDVDGVAVLAVAIAGVALNLTATRILAAGQRRSLNLEGAFQHVLTDLYAFAGTALAAVVIIATGFDRADPIASLAVVALMLWAAWGLLSASGRVFMEAAPAGVDPAAIGQGGVRPPPPPSDVVEVHDLHVWEVTSGFPALSAHVRVTRDSDCHEARRRLEQLLRERFGIEHTTLQMEHEEPLLLQVEEPRTNR